MASAMTQDGEAASRGQASDLFGRGMLYVVIWSMQMIAAVVVSPVLAYTLPVAGFGSLSAPAARCTRR